MFAVVCPKCETELQVPNNLAGCLIRCHECDAISRAPHPEVEDESSATPAYVVQAKLDPAASGTKDIQDFVRQAEQRAKEEAERKPYHRGEVPVDLIAGIGLVVAGLLLGWLTLRGVFGTSLFPILFFGTTSLAMFLGGLVCLVICYIHRNW